MRNIFQSFIVLTTMMLVITSCSSDRSREEKVAAMISTIDSPFLVVNTLPGDLIKKSGAMDGALPFTQEMMVGFFLDEAVTGVDYDVNLQIIVGKGESFTPNFYGIFKLKDEAVFVELLETEANAEVLEKEGYKYIIKASDNYVIVWNDEFAIASNIPTDIMTMMMGGGAKEGDATVDELIAMLESAEEGEVNDEYLTFLSHKADVSLSFIGKGFYQYSLEMSMGETDDIEANREKIEGLNLDMFMYFNEGSVDFQFLSHFSDVLKDEISFMKNAPVNPKYLGFGNSDNPLFTMGWNVDFAKALDYAQNNEGTMNGGDLEEELERMGLTVEAAKSALSGEVFVMVDRVDQVKRTVDYGYGDPYSYDEPAPLFALVLGVQDAAILAKAFGDSLTEGTVLKNGDAYILLKDNVLFSSNDSVWAAKINTGAGTRISDQGNVFASTPFGMFLNMAGLANMEALGDARIAAVILSSVKGSGSLEEINISMNLNDKSKNALRVITETISNMAEGGVEVDPSLEEEIEAAAALEALNADS